MAYLRFIIKVNHHNNNVNVVDVAATLQNIEVRFLIYGGVCMRTQSKFKNEAILNKYYNLGKFNSPAKIGYMMKMIRELKPVTMMEWMYWYFANWHDFSYLYNLAVDFWRSIPASYGITFQEALAYVGAVMFERTFAGYDKEETALHILRSTINPEIQESPAEWDNLYFVDFYYWNSKGQLIGIQLKPESFQKSHCENFVAIDEKMKTFRDKFHAQTFVLFYKQEHSTLQSIEQFFANPEMIDLMKQIAA